MTRLRRDSRQNCPLSVSYYTSLWMTMQRSADFCLIAAKHFSTSASATSSPRDAAILGLRSSATRCSFPSASLSSLVLWALGISASRSASLRRREKEQSFLRKIKGARQRSKSSLRILWRGRRRDSSEKPSTWSTHSGTAEYGHMGDGVYPVRVTHTKRKGASAGPLSVVHP